MLDGSDSPFDGVRVRSRGVAESVGVGVTVAVTVGVEEIVGVGTVGVAVSVGGRVIVENSTLKVCSNHWV